MDTPERSQIDTPISKIEESPFSNFANSLSPIKPVKAALVSQTFSSLNFTSPPSVFTSPHVSNQKESRFLRRHQLSDLSKPDFCTSELKNDGENEGVLAPIKKPDHPVNDEGFIGTGQPTTDASAEPLDEDSELAMPMALQYDRNSPKSLTAPCSDADIEGCEQDMLALVPFGQQTPRGEGSFGAESNDQSGNENNEGEGNEWQGLISSAVDLLNFESPNNEAILQPNNEAILQGPFKRSMGGETSFFASVLSNCPHGHVNEMQHVHDHSDVNFSEHLLDMNQLDQPTDANDLDQMSQGEDNLASTSITEGFSAHGNPIEESESVYSLHRGMRRRCLVFEIPGSRKNMKSGLGSSSLNTSKEEERIVATCTSLVPDNVGGESSHHGLPGIGLHLNSLAIVSKDSKCFKREVHTSIGQPSSLHVSCKSFHPPTTEEPLTTSASTSLDKEMNPVDNGNQLIVGASQATEYGSSQEFNQKSPKKKRRKSENSGETEACKRCNCKKSKCLKLYCECFAAGVYCMEPCSCQDCFNKPIHEDTVLATRKQIESRNPLAFAPKVIRSSDSISDLGQDESTRTPASARHKRGCNCKKSNCLKKYCECYQGGVGCSVNCRCEGCKNAFGRKDGSSLMGTEYETAEVTPVPEKSLAAKHADQNRIQNDDEQNPEFVIPETPLIPFSSSLPQSLPLASKGKPPRSSSQIVTSSGLHPGDELGRSTFLRPQQHKMEKHLQPPISGDDMPAHLQNTNITTSPSSGNVKTLSPNSKRVSLPHHDIGQSSSLRSSRKLILQSIPSFPSLTPR